LHSGGIETAARCEREWILTQTALAARELDRADHRWERNDDVSDAIRLYWDMRSCESTLLVRPWIGMPGMLVEPKVPWGAVQIGWRPQAKYNESD